MNQGNEQENIEPLQQENAATLYPPTEQLEHLIKKQDKNKRKKFLIFILCLAFILGFEFFGVSGSGRIMGLVKWLCIFFIVLWPGMYFLVALHEFGHTAMGWLAGKKLLVFCIGRWRFEDSVGGWRWRHPRSLPGISGFCMMRPAALEKPISRLGEVGFLLGGGMANLVCAALFWGIFSERMFSNTLMNAMLLGLAVISLFFGVLNLLPLNLKNGWRTDGRQAWDLWRNGQDEDFKRVNELAKLAYFNIRARDGSVEQVSLLDEIKLDGKPFVLHCAVNILKFQYACDRKSWTEAEPVACWIAQNFVLIPDGQRQGVAAAMAIYALYGKNDQRLFEAWQIWCDDAALLNLRAYRALFNAWLAYFAGEYEQAQQGIEEIRLAMPSLPFQQSVVYMQEYLDDLQAHLQKAYDLKIVQ